MSLLYYQEKFSSLQRFWSNGVQKPHKIILLLAVMDLIRDGRITENRIFFEEPLRAAFKTRFESIASDRDRNRPHTPFFHLRSSGFWHHKVKHGRQDAYGDLQNVGGPGAITDNIEYAYFDDELFEYLLNDVARRLLEVSLLNSLEKNGIDDILGVGKEWNWLDCEIIVRDYFDMLDKELAGAVYSAPPDNKYRSVSAVLDDLDQPFLECYPPDYNYPKQLKQVVLAHLVARGPENASFDWSHVVDTDIPDMAEVVAESQRTYHSRHANFEERERVNRRTGELGEEFVLEFERFRMRHHGRPDLADEVEWSSKVRGDGLGYDIQSFDLVHDRELFIEVKTTNGDKHQPFFITPNEVAFSKERADQYQLSRVYNFRVSPRLLQLPGDVELHVRLAPQNYKASFS